MSIIQIGKSREVVQTKCRGRVYYKNGIFYGKRRCNICGQWITWQGQTLQEQAKTCVDPSVVWKEGGTSSCEDWQHLRKKHFADNAENWEDERQKKAMNNFRYLKEKGIIK